MAKFATFFTFKGETINAYIERPSDRAAAARSGLRATGVGYDRRVTVVQFIAGFVLFAISIAASIGVFVGEAAALFFVAAIGVLSLVWGVFNTWELIFRVQGLDQP